MVFEKIVIWFSTIIFRIIERLCLNLPYFSFIKNTKKTQTPITFRMWWDQKVKGNNRYCYWPVHKTSLVVNYRNVYAGVETCPGYMPGCYIQAIGKIYIGDYTQIAPQVGIISANHDLYDNREHVIKEVRIGKYCWLGMGAKIMPGVILGDYTIVGAGSVVTKSFPEGYCVIGGNPARIIKHLEQGNCVFHKSEIEYNGYIPANEFNNFRSRNLFV